MNDILRGEVFGADQNELRQNARRVAATYFGVQPDFVNIMLSDARFAPRTGAGMDTREPRFAADFRATVKA